MEDDEENSGINFMAIALMAGNYHERCVDKWCSDDGTKMVSTAQVFDGGCPFETAFQHPEYNDGAMIIVEAYDTMVEARGGHARWIEVMREGPLPDVLHDCCNAEVAAKGAVLGMPREFKRKP